jgi:hypothetical protein
LKALSEKDAKERKKEEDEARKLLKTKMMNMQGLD